MSEAEVIERPQTSDPDLKGEDRAAHIGRREDVTRGYIEGVPIEALCGQVFVPSRNPDNYPNCQGCDEIMRQIQSARGGNN